MNAMGHTWYLAHDSNINENGLEKRKYNKYEAVLSSPFPILAKTFTLQGEEDVEIGEE